jgi:hypothetical protein
VLGELRGALAERGFARLADAVGYAHRAKVGDEHRPVPAAAARPAWRLGGDEP